MRYAVSWRPRSYALLQAALPQSLRLAHTRGKAASASKRGAKKQGDEVPVQQISDDATSTPSSSATTKRRPALAELDMFKPEARKGLEIAGSDEKRIAAKRAVYNLAMRRLTVHFSKEDLLRLGHQVRVIDYHFSRRSRILRKDEVIDLIIRHHWDIENPDSDATGTTARAMSNKRDKAKRGKTNDILLPRDFQPRQDLLEHCAGLTGGICRLVPPDADEGDAKSDGGSRVTYAAANQQRRVELERLLSIAIHEDYMCSRSRPIPILSPDSLYWHFPFRHRRAWPWFWGSAPFNTRFRALRKDPRLELEDTDAESLPEIKSLSPTCGQVIDRMRHLIPETLDQTIFMHITMGYLLYPRFHGHQFANEPVPSAVYAAHLKQERSRFLTDIPPRSLFDVQRLSLSQGFERREVVYQLVSIGKEAERHLPPHRVQLRLCTIPDQRDWEASVEEIFEVDLAMPGCAMDARLCAVRQHQVDISEDWLSSFLEAAAEAASSPLVLESSHTPLGAQPGRWCLKRDANTRRRDIEVPETTPDKAIFNHWQSHDRYRRSALEVQSMRPGVTAENLMELLSISASVNALSNVDVRS